MCGVRVSSRTRRGRECQWLAGNADNRRGARYRSRRLARAYTNGGRTDETAASAVGTAAPGGRHGRGSGNCAMRSTVTGLRRAGGRSRAPGMQTSSPGRRTLVSAVLCPEGWPTAVEDGMAGRRGGISGEGRGGARTYEVRGAFDRSLKPSNNARETETRGDGGARKDPGLAGRRRGVAAVARGRGHGPDARQRPSMNPAWVWHSVLELEEIRLRIR